MDSYIAISTLNDFLFCPKSIYFHQLYQPYRDAQYKELAQQAGTFAHETVDTQSYSSSSQILQGISVFSEKFGINGKIDLFHIDKKSLLERKKLIKKVHPGYILQIHAQYYCLTEMGYDVQTLKLYSLDDNRVYPIELPTSSDTASFIKILGAYRSFDPDDPYFSQNSKKCTQCIYRELCDYYLRTHG